jgi:hypothetical protein
MELMPYEDQFSQYPSMKGIAVELPFFSFKYVKVDKGQAEQSRSSSSKAIDLIVPDEETPLTVPSRVMVSRRSEVTTLGMDPMISNASVIHELTYGRIETAQNTAQPPSYSGVFEPSPHSLDIII